MFSATKQFAYQGVIYEVEQGSGPPTPPANGYVAENGTTFYVAEDGVTFYVQEV